MEAWSSNVPVAEYSSLMQLRVIIVKRAFPTVIGFGDAIGAQLLELNKISAVMAMVRKRRIEAFMRDSILNKNDRKGSRQF